MSDPKENKKKYEERLKKIIKGIQETAEALGVHPTEVTKAQFFKHVDTVNDWDLRVVGGLPSIKRSHFPVVEKDLLTIRKTKAVNKYVNELEKMLGEQQLAQDNMIKAVKEAVAEAKVNKITVPKRIKNKRRKMTMEAMLSDIHYGKKSDTFNIEVCRERIRKFTSVFLKEIEDNDKIFNVEKILVSMLGDLIESYTMHGLESAVSCEVGNAKQIQYAIESLYKDFLVPVAKTGIKVEVNCVTGNHDRTETKRTMNNPGENNMTWVIYNSLLMLCQASGLKNVTFNIPAESYALVKIYNNYCLIEHGDNHGNNKTAIEAHIAKRAKQLGVIIDFYRFGHWHEYVCYDRGRMIGNESVCGQDSYAQVLGYASTAGQTINYYIETEDRPNCFYKSFPVYLG